MDGRRIEIRGTVQGVGFRPWVYRLARGLGVTGRVLNDGRGVSIDAFGSGDLLDAFLRRLDSELPPAAEIAELSWRPIPTERAVAFVIAPSQGDGVRRPSIPPDLATCPDCLAEVLDAGDRRHGYAFTNCTNCGPRFSIAQDVPYDRRATTMAPFEMCPECRREYEAVVDRRFHAQPNACPVCGPQLRLVDPMGRAIASDEPIATVAELLAAGRIVAIKGLGGYHLACDATRQDVVGELRRRKQRDEKPFAVMVADLAAAARCAQLDPAARKLLTSVERPIVLLPRTSDSPLASAVAPDCARVGLFLPYTPLHHLILRAFGGPVVLTSANLSDEPIVTADDEALARLATIADAVLAHDRAIENRTDDSVTMVVAGEPVVLRRSRGYVPRPIALGRPLSRPILACGADLKNTFCLAEGASALLGPHIGDLENFETYVSFTEAIRRLEQFTGITPEIVAHDLHPRYASTRYALEREGVVPVGVQHHHAHVASAMAEHGLEGPVLGVAYDGTGYGTDGTAWGTEVLWADLGGFERIATARPIPLAGGDAAIRQVWRITLALVDDAFDGRPPDRVEDFFGELPESSVQVVRQMIRRQVNAPLARGLGRLFDGLGGLCLGRRTASFEGQIAMAWEQAADRHESGTYPYALARRERPWTFDFRPTIRAAVGDWVGGCSPAAISARFHRSLVAATLEVVRSALAERGPRPIVLTGGCFQNLILAEGLLEALASEAPVVLQRRVPPNDGGVALGQLVVADAVIRQRVG